MYELFYTISESAWFRKGLYIGPDVASDLGSLTATKCPIKFPLLTAKHRGLARYLIAMDPRDGSS